MKSAAGIDKTQKLDARGVMKIEPKIIENQSDTLLRYQLFVKSQPISVRAFLVGLTSSLEFRRCFRQVLTDAPFTAYRFETPALHHESLDDVFEFVLINAPGLASRAADPHTFAEYFSFVESQVPQGVVEFKSLGGDATLIAPVPISSHETYIHLAGFVRHAPERQVDALWQIAGEAVSRDVGAAPLWLNTEGSGVAWLHVRIDTRPKYYGYIDYKQVRGKSVHRSNGTSP